jgi:spore coat protein U-like protein
MRTTRLAAWVGAGLLALSISAHGSCRVVGGNLSFGPYDPLSPYGSATSGTLTVICTASPPTDVRILMGPSERSGGFTPRRMKNDETGDSLAYNLYVEPSGTAVWGDGTAGTATMGERVAVGKPWTVTIYGRMPGRQDVAPGLYGDRVGITIEF